MPKVTEEYFEKKRREIIDAAYRVCARKPVATIEMKDVIAETGFSHGVIYRYYKDLDEVLRDLVSSINSEHRVDDKIDSILAGDCGWEDKIRSICRMLADQMCDVGVELMKISLYSDTLAMSEPERALKIGEKLDNAGQSPLMYVVSSMTVFLTETISRNKLKPSYTVDEILQYFIVTFQGIQTGFVMADCFKIQGRYEPHLMFDCLATSTISMMKGD